MKLVADKIVFAILIAVYYWMWARSDWKDSYTTVQTIVGIFSFYYFVSRALRLRKYKKEMPDEMAETNLKRSDSICLKIGVGALVLLSFVCVVGRFALTTGVIGYCMVGVLVLLAILRTVIFYLMDRKGLWAWHFSQK